MAFGIALRQWFQKTGWNQYCNQLIAKELNGVLRYCGRIFQLAPTQADKGVLFDAIPSDNKHIVLELEQLPDLSEDAEPAAILFNGTFNHHYDIQSLLTQLHQHLPRQAVVCSVIYNPYLSWLYKLANRLGIREGDAPTTFLTKVSLSHIAQLSGFHITRTRQAVYCPFRLWGLGSLINSVMPWVPLLRHLSFSSIVTLKPIKPLQVRPALSIVIPARNEQGHIEQAIRRIPDMGCPLEIIFVEGHSTDDTWGEIQRQVANYQGPYQIKAFQQTGKGKVDAVRLGFSKASGSVLTILDADLTMPPEKLPQFYEAYVSGKADFINGSRLVYPMEGQAMRFLNRLGNGFFAKALSWVLDVPISDSLCGTKLVSRLDYQRFERWRSDFGDFDPFGDFELLFPAATMGLGIVDIPVRYAARQYGETNIHRFRHGLILLKMTLVAFWYIKMGQTRELSE